MAKNMMKVVSKLTENEKEKIMDMIRYHNKNKNFGLSNLLVMARNEVTKILLRNKSFALAKKVDPWLPLKEFYAFFVATTIMLSIVLLIAAAIFGGIAAIVYLGLKINYLYLGLVLPFGVLLFSAGVTYFEFYHYE